MKLFAIACGLQRDDGNSVVHTVTLHTRSADSAEAAKASAVDEALRLKTGFEVWEVLCMEVEERPVH